MCPCKSRSTALISRRCEHHGVGTATGGGERDGKAGSAYHAPARVMRRSLKVTPAPSKQVGDSATRTCLDYLPSASPAQATDANRHPRRVAQRVRYLDHRARQTTAAQADLSCPSESLRRELPPVPRRSRASSVQAACPALAVWDPWTVPHTASPAMIQMTDCCSQHRLSRS